MAAGKLTVRVGGLGIRRVSSLATPAFIASAVGMHNLQDQILNTAPGSSSELDIYQQSWQANYGDMPTLTSPAKQQTWDKPIIQLELSQLMERDTDTYDKARLLSIK